MQKKTMEDQRDFAVNLLSYHVMDTDAQKQSIAIRDAAQKFVQVIVENTPVNAEQTLAIRAVSNALMLSNQSIAMTMPTVEEAKGSIHFVEDHDLTLHSSPEVTGPIDDPNTDPDNPGRSMPTTASKVAMNKTEGGAEEPSESERSL